MVSGEAGGCGNHYSQNSLVGEIHPQKGHLRVSRGLLHKTVQPSPQSVLPLPAFRPCGDRLQGRICQVQALRREPRDRALSSKEGGKSGGCDKVRKLSGPSSCFQHEVPLAERGGEDNCGRPGGAPEAQDRQACPSESGRVPTPKQKDTSPTDISPAGAKGCQTKEPQTNKSTKSPQYQGSSSSQEACFSPTQLITTRDYFERSRTFLQFESFQEECQEEREGEDGEREDGTGEVGSRVSSHCDYSPSSSPSSEPSFSEFFLEEENGFPQRIIAEESSYQGDLCERSSKSPCKIGQGSSSCPRSEGSGGPERVSLSSSHPPGGSPRSFTHRGDGDGERRDLSTNRDSSGSSQHYSSNHSGPERAAKDCSKTHGHGTRGPQSDASGGQDLHNNSTQSRLGTGGAPLRFLSWNACSLKLKFPALTQVALSDNLDIICIQESFMSTKPNGQPPLKIPGYATFFLPKILGRTRGLITFVKNSIPSEKFDFVSDVGKATEVTQGLFFFLMFIGKSPT